MAPSLVASSSRDQLPALARELVALRPDLIVAFGPQPNRAVKDATSTIPIVMVAVADPVKAGLVTNLARPGGNLTGVTTVVPGGIMAKQLDLLHQMVPKATRIGMLVNPTNEIHRILVPLEIPDAARQLDVQIILVEARTADEIEPALLRSANEPRRCSSMVIRCSTARLSGFRKSWRARASRRSTSYARKRRRVG